MDCDEIEAAAAKLVSKYKDDLDQTLGVELVQFAAFLTHFLEYEKDEKIKNKIGREQFLYKLLMEKKVADTFPNVAIMLRMYLVLMVKLFWRTFIQKIEVHQEQTMYYNMTW